jgi:hypothetical protein
LKARYNNPDRGRLPAQPSSKMANH